VHLPIPIPIDVPAPIAVGGSTAFSDLGRLVRLELRYEVPPGGDVRNLHLWDADSRFFYWDFPAKVTADLQFGNTELKWRGNHAIANSLGVSIGVVKEIKPDEYRVALTPAGARELVLRGHEVLVETGAGEGSAFADRQYEAVGARLGGADDVWAGAELLLKVKEPLPDEYPRLREGQILFTYLHLAASKELT